MGWGRDCHRRLVDAESGRAGRALWACRPDEKQRRPALCVSHALFKSAAGSPTPAALAFPCAQGAEGSFAMKRSWDDDVVFRNQTRGEPKAQRRFINDTIRSDFHRRFLEKCVR